MNGRSRFQAAQELERLDTVELGQDVVAEDHVPAFFVQGLAHGRGRLDTLVDGGTVRLPQLPQDKGRVPFRIFHQEHF